MDLQHTTTLSTAQTEAIFRLWNNEYPAGLGYLFPAQLESYLQSLEEPQHYFLRGSNGFIYAWAVTFRRDSETWFAIILHRESQGKGHGSRLLERLQSDHTSLCGWVADTNAYLRADGSAYPSPLLFYLKKGFEVLPPQRLEVPQLSAVKICWQAGAAYRQKG